MSKREEVKKLNDELKNERPRFVALLSKTPRVGEKLQSFQIFTEHCWQGRESSSVVTSITPIKDGKYLIRTETTDYEVFLNFKDGT